MDPQPLKEAKDELTRGPEDGCYVHGMFIEGATWDFNNMVLIDSRPKELYTYMPGFWLQPSANRDPPDTGVYYCPVYKTLTRAGESGTGHWVLGTGCWVLGR